jgi:putative ABC transport system permease protein
MPLFHALLFFRIIVKSREVYCLKIVTLAIAFACSMLILLFTFHEFGYDRFHEDYNSTFRILQRNNNGLYSGNRLSNKVSSGVFTYLKTVSNDSLITSRVKLMRNVNVLAGNLSFDDFNFYVADPEITDIFSFELLDGSVDEFHGKERTVMLSSSRARKFFGTNQSKGKKLKIFTLGDSLLFTVAAVYKDFPQNSHEEFNSFIRFDSSSIRSLSFNPNEVGIYVKLLQGSETYFENLLNKIIQSGDLTYRFQSLSEIYFGPRLLGEDSKHGDHYSIIILIFITVLILFLATTSFVNLTTLTLPYRSKELAIKKLAGTSQVNLIVDFARESFLIVGTSFALGIIFLALASNWLKAILSLDLMAFLWQSNLRFSLIVIGLFVIIAITPLLATLRFASATPNRLLSTDAITFPRFKRVIMFLQLGVSIFLIGASTVIRRQISYSLLKEPGRNHDQIVYVSYPENFSNADLARLRTTWKAINPNVIDLMATSQLPDRINSKELNSDFYFMSVDRGYKDFFELQMVQGNWFKVNDGDSISVVNEQGVRLLQSNAANVIGVFKDISGQFNQPEKPIKINVAPHFNFNFLCIRILEVDIRRTVKFLETYFERDGQKATVSFLNKRFEEWMRYQDKLNRLSAVLAIISGLMSCCAVYGLSISIVRDKLKQIAIHKLFGAGTFGLTRILVREFASQMLVAILFFGPVTYIVLSEMLRTFVYATKFSWLDPLIPIAYCVTIIILLCGFQTLSLNREDLTSALKGLR